MTKYRLKKDAPMDKAGTIFELHDDCEHEWLASDECKTQYQINRVDNFDEWFEEVQESGWWKPQSNEEYFFVNSWGAVFPDTWDHSTLDCGRLSIGNCFKTQEAAERFANYMEAIATVRQDEGVLTPEQAVNNGYIYYICIHNEFGLVVHGFNADYVSVNTVLFDTREHAQASRDKHPDEWKTIANYDWSRG